MTFKSQPNHVAILVPSVSKTADFLRKFAFQNGPEEMFETTKEIYIEREQSNSLLLIEPNKTGSYQRALEKRGPGIHHIAIDVLDIKSFMKTIESSGWLLHPSSIRTVKHSRTAWLARPGFPSLIEVQEQEKLEKPSKNLFVNEIGLSNIESFDKLKNAIGMIEIIKNIKEPYVKLAENVILIKDLCK